MIDNEILDNYEPASCFDKIKTRGRPKLQLNATGIINPCYHANPHHHGIKPALIFPLL